MGGATHPQNVLNSIEREELDELDGPWGDPKAGSPIQVDVIDVETDEQILSIEVFNRAIGLFEEDFEELRRIHRACQALEAADSDGPDRSMDAGNAAADVVAASTLQPPQIARARTDLSSVLRQHRRQPGMCALCGEVVSRAGALTHLTECAPAHDERSGTEQRLVHLRVTAPGLPAYWLEVEARTDARLEALDFLLRNVWLECCDHLSIFTIQGRHHFSRGYDFRGGGQFSMNGRLADVLPEVGGRFSYEYDFGSTTSLQIGVVRERTGRIGRIPVRLLARNAPPVWPCAICSEAATSVCAFCRHDEGNPFVCTEHRSQHACDEEGGFRPIVNSPRTGVCGYAAET